MDQDAQVRRAWGCAGFNGEPRLLQRACSCVAAACFIMDGPQLCH